jgi:excisionase family DNA binding protein
MIDRMYYTPEEVAKRFKLSLSTIYNLIDKGDLPSIKLGKCYRIPHSELSEYLKNRSKKSVLKTRLKLPLAVMKFVNLMGESNKKKNVLSIRLFGSYARSDYTAKSDIDLLIVVKDLNSKMSDLISEISDEAMSLTDYEEFLSVIQLSETQWAKAKKNNTPFYNSVSKESLELWKK